MTNRDRLLRKQAALGLSGLLSGASVAADVAGVAGKATGSFTGSMASYILAAGLATGAATGFAAAKLSAHGKKDQDSVGLYYTNERLKADIAHVKTSLEQEYDRQKRTQAPKAARIM